MHRVDSPVVSVSLSLLCVGRMPPASRESYRSGVVCVVLFGQHVSTSARQRVNTTTGIFLSRLCGRPTHLSRRRWAGFRVFRVCMVFVVFVVFAVS